MAKYRQYGRKIEKTTEYEQFGLFDEAEFEGKQELTEPKLEEITYQRKNAKVNGRRARKSQRPRRSSLPKPMFKLEKGYRELSSAERYAQRLKHSQPQDEAFLIWAKSQAVLPQSALEQWPYLNHVFLDGGGRGGGLKNSFQSKVSSV